MRPSFGREQGLIPKKYFLISSIKKGPKIFLFVQHFYVLDAVPKAKQSTCLCFALPSAQHQAQD